MLLNKSLNERSNNFYLLNIGLTISAKSVKYDNKNDLATIEFEDDEVHGDIDVTDIVSILKLFNIDTYPNKNENPIISYTGKGQCIKNYINIHKEMGNSIQNPYTKTKYIMPDIFKLYDHLEKKYEKIL